MSHFNQDVVSVHPLDSFGMPRAVGHQIPAPHTAFWLDKPDVADVVSALDGNKAVNGWQHGRQLAHALAVGYHARHYAGAVLRRHTSFRRHAADGGGDG
jgi:hypothetical protein